MNNNTSNPQSSVGILFVANYSPSAGFAWNNIYKLFFNMADKLNAEGYRCYISFKEIDNKDDTVEFEEHFL